MLIGVDGIGIPWIATREKPELPSAGWWNNLRTPCRGGYSSKMPSTKKKREILVTQRAHRKQKALQEERNLAHYKNRQLRILGLPEGKGRLAPQNGEGTKTGKNEPKAVFKRIGNVSKRRNRNSKL